MRGKGKNTLRPRKSSKKAISDHQMFTSHTSATSSLAEHSPIHPQLMGYPNNLLPELSKATHKALTPNDYLCLFFTKGVDSLEFHTAMKRQNKRGRTGTQNRTEYLKSSTEVYKFTEKALHVKWQGFLADLEHNPDPSYTWYTIKALSGVPVSMAFTEPSPLVHIRRSFLSNKGKANAFMKTFWNLLKT